MGEIAVFLGEIGVFLIIISVLFLGRSHIGKDDIGNEISYFENMFCFKGVNLENFKKKLIEKPKLKNGQNFFKWTIFWLKCIPEFIYFLFAISLYIGFICLILGLILVLIYYNF